MTDATLNLSIDAGDARRGADEFDRSAKKVQGGAREATRELDRTEKKTSQLSNTFKTLAKAALAAGAALASREILRAADQYTQLENRIRVANDGLGNVTNTLNRLFDVSQRTRTPLAANVQLFQRASVASKELGATQQDLIRFTENVGKALALESTSAQQASGALLQLSQALGGGIVRAEEFNSIIDGAPAILQSAARNIEGVNGSLGKLRREVVEGNISSREFFQAILADTDTLNQKFQNVTPTIESAFQTLDNAFLRLIGRNEEVRSTSGIIAEGIIFVADNLDTLAVAAIAAGGALGAQYVTGVIAANTATLTLGGTLAAVGTTLAKFIPVALIGGAIFAVIEYFNELRATMTLLVGESLKFANTFQSYIVGALRGVINAVSETGQVFDGLLLDMRDFVTDPLSGGSGFSNTRDAIRNAFVGGFKEAFDETRREAEQFNRAIDDSVNDTLIEIKRKVEETEEPLGELFTPPSAPETPLVQELEKAKTKTEELGQEAAEVEQIFEDTASGIQSAFNRTFEDLFSGQLDSFSDFADSIKQVFVRMLAQLATLAIASPVIVPIVTSIGGALGVDSAGIESVVGQLSGGGSGLSGLGGLSSLLGGGGDMLSGAMDLINQTGADLFGTFSGVGPQLPGVDQTLTGIIGETFSGSWGGAIANLMGLGSGNMLMDTGTSLAGAAIGNLIFPGIGGIVGSFAGTALGGLFGGKSRPHPASNFGAGGFSAGGQLVNPAFSSKHVGTEQAQALAELVNNAVGGLSGMTGINFGGINSFQGGVDDGTGFFSLGDFKAFDQNTFTFNPEDEADANRALSETIIEMVRRVEGAGEAIRGDLIPALESIETEGRTLDEVLSDVAFIANFDNIGDAILNTEEPLSAFQVRMQQIREEFAAAEEAAERLGLPLGELAERLTAVEDKIRSDFNESLANQLLGQQSGIFGDLATENERYQQQLTNAKEINADLALVEAIHAENLRRINEQYNGVEDNLERTIRQTESLISNYDRIADNLNNAIFGMQIGENSNLSPQEKLALAEQRFFSTAARARGGDAAAAQALPNIANEFSNIARELYGSEARFDDIFDSIINELSAAEEFYRSEISIMNEQLDISRAQLDSSRNLESLFENSNLTKVNSLANPDVMVGANNVNEAIIRILPQLSEMQAETTIQLLRAATPGITPGGGTRSIFFEQNPAANAALMQALRTTGIPGFARGGRPFSTSPSLVGENGIEVMTPPAGSSIIPIQNNAAMLNQFITANRHLSASVRILQAGLTRLEEQQIQTNEQLARLNTKANRRAA